MEGTARFTASLLEVVDAAGGAATLSASFEFERFLTLGADHVTRTRRRFCAASVALAIQGVSYSLVGTATADETSAPASFVRVQRGVLVGRGPRNNELLTLSLRFDEQADGTASIAFLGTDVGPQSEGIAPISRGLDGPRLVSDSDEGNT